MILKVLLHDLLLLLNIMILMVAFSFTLIVFCWLVTLFFFLIIVLALLYFIYKLITDQEFLEKCQFKLFVLKIFFLLGINHALQSIPEEWKKWILSDLKFIIIILIYVWFFFRYMY